MFSRRSAWAKADSSRRTQDLLTQLPALNLDVAARLERGERVTAPGVPVHYPNPAALITADCIRPVA